MNIGRRDILTSTSNNNLYKASKIGHFKLPWCNANTLPLRGRNPGSIPRGGISLLRSEERHSTSVRGCPQQERNEMVVFRSMQSTYQLSHGLFHHAHLNQLFQFSFLPTD